MATHDRHQLDRVYGGPSRQRFQAWSRRARRDGREGGLTSSTAGMNGFGNLRTMSLRSTTLSI
jgi:hypothetical protein